MMAALLALLSGAARPLAIAALIALAALGVVGGSGWAGYHLRGQSCDRAAAELRADQATALASAEASAAARYRAATEHIAQLDADLAAARQNATSTATAVKSRIVYVTTNYVPAGASAPVALPRCVFTRGWVRDYNAALGLPAGEQAPAASGPGDPPDASAPADPWLLDSGVTERDILAHVADYGAWCRGLAAHVDGLIATQSTPEP